MVKQNFGNKICNHSNAYHKIFGQDLKLFGQDFEDHSTWHKLVPLHSTYVLYMCNAVVTLTYIRY